MKGIGSADAASAAPIVLKACRRPVLKFFIAVSIDDYIRYPIYAPDECLYCVAYALTLGLREGHHKRNMGMRVMTNVHSLVAWFPGLTGSGM
jgi:hypothetical protein